MRRIYSYISILLVSIVATSTIFAQDNTQFGLPDGAIARLGKGGINVMKFSPDGTSLAVGTDIGLWIYDVASGKETPMYTGLTSQVNTLAFSQDGTLLATGGINDPVITVWNMVTKGKHTNLMLPAGRFQLSKLVFYGRVLISINGLSLNSNREIVYWNVNTGRILSESKIYEPFDAVAFSQDGNFLAGAGVKKGEIHLLDTTTKSRKWNLKGHGKRRLGSKIWSMVFSPDGKILASGSIDKTVKIWNLENHSELATLKGHSGWVTTVAIAMDRKTFASGDAKNGIKVWDLDTYQERATLIGHKNTINALAFAPIETPVYGMCLASGSADGTIRFWDTSKGKEITTFTSGHTEWVKAVSFSNNGRTLMSAAFNGTVDIWDLKTHKKQSAFTAGQTNRTITVALSPNGEYFVCHGSPDMIAFKSSGFGRRSAIGGSNNLQVWNLTTGEKLAASWQEIDHYKTSAAFSTDNNLLAVSSYKEIRAWDLNTRNELFQLNLQQPMFNIKIKFSPDGKKIAVVNSSQMSQVWDIPTLKDITPLKIKDVDTIEFSPDSSMVTMVSSDEIHRLKFGMLHGDERAIHHGMLWGFNRVLTSSPDGTILVGSMDHGTDGLINLYDVVTENSLSSLSGHTELIETLVFSHDGKILASGSMDGTVILWDWDKIISKARKLRGLTDEK